MLSSEASNGCVQLSLSLVRGIIAVTLDNIMLAWSTAAERSVTDQLLAPTNLVVLKQLRQIGLQCAGHHIMCL